jgi:hypothetical protein
MERTGCGARHARRPWLPRAHSFALALALIVAAFAGPGARAAALAPDSGAGEAANSRPLAAPAADAPIPPGPPVGRIDATTKARLRAVWQAGQALGRRPNVFAKVGDSITASGSFLSDVGDGRAVLGGRADLAPIIAYYRAAIVDRAGGRAHNALNRRSLAAKAGWTGADILGLPDGDLAQAPVTREYAAVDPAVALIMFGTNDLDRTGVDFYSQNLSAVVETTLRAGIIPVLSTIPDRRDTPQAAYRTLPYNDAVRELAARERVPVIEYWGALQDLPNGGLGPDLVHPSIYPHHGAATFSPRGLTYGWNLRNFLTLQMLAHLKAVVIDDGPPDP